LSVLILTYVVRQTVGLRVSGFPQHLRLELQRAPQDSSLG